MNATVNITTFGFSMTFVNEVLYLCLPGCLHCTDPSTCLICLPGYAKDSSNDCINCGPLCETCDISDLTICTSCLSGYYNDNGTCIQCSDNCLTCSAFSECTSCPTGFTLAGIACIPCIENCIACSQLTAPTNARCDICLQGYVYSSVSQKCIKCASGCSVC